MKVAYDYQTFSLQKYGGISRYFYEVASRLYRMDDIKVTILAFAYINKYLKDADRNLVIGLERAIIPKTSKIFNNLNENLCKLSLCCQPPDILHETYYFGKNFTSKKYKTVLTVYDMIDERFSDTLSGSSSEKSKLKRLAIKRADHVICISESTKRDLLEFIDVDPAKITVIHIGNSFVHASRSTQKVCTEPYFLYVGLRDGYKNFNTLLKAYASSSKINKNFKLFCFGINPFSNSEKDQITQLGLKDSQVVYVGSRDETLAQLYCGASALAYPSLYEGFGIPPLEAMSLGCPVICSNVSSIPEVVGDAAELFDPYSVESITFALEKVLFSTKKSEELICKGLNRVKLFSWDRCAYQTAKLYNSLL